MVIPLLLSLILSSVLSDDPGEITIDGTTLPLRDCRGPVFSGHDAGLVALAASGLAFSIFWAISLLVGIGLFIRKSPAAPIVFGVSIVLLLIGGPLLGTGAYYGRWEKVYDVHTGCDALPRIVAPDTIPAAALQTPVNFTIAYVGDSSASINTIGVWQAIIAEHPDALVHLGDYDYCDDPTLWGRHLKFFFGTNFPIIPVIGNHELHLWGDYSTEWDSFGFWQNHTDNDFIVCDGIKYVQWWCIIRGVFIAFSSVGTKCGDGYWDHTWHNSEQERMLRLSQQARFQDPYINCVWHKNYNNFQLSTSRDEAGFDIYDICASYGALTVNGHDHVYGRTQAINNAQDPDVQGFCEEGRKDCVYDLTTKDATIIAVSGLGGWDKPDLDPNLVRNDWWAKTYNGQFGALICKYNFNGSGQVYCYFKDANGNIADEFTFEQKSNIVLNGTK